MKFDKCGIYQLKNRSSELLIVNQEKLLPGLRVTTILQSLENYTTKQLKNRNFLQIDGVFSQKFRPKETFCKKEIYLYHGTKQLKHKTLSGKNCSKSKSISKPEFVLNASLNLLFTLSFDSSPASIT